MSGGNVWVCAPGKNVVETETRGFSSAPSSGSVGEPSCDFYIIKRQSKHQFSTISRVLTGGVGTWEYGEPGCLLSSSGVVSEELDTNWNRESQFASSMQISLGREKKANHQR